jgi:exopolysaccharide biosynthesis polyprenyl glycosylphosphotransferase
MAALPRALGPLAAALVAFVVEGVGTGFEPVLVFLALVAGFAIADRRPGWGHLLPLMGRVVRLGGPAIGLGILLLLHAIGALPGVRPGAAVVLALGSAAVWWLTGKALARHLYARRPVRVAVIGSTRAADSFQRELRVSGLHGYEVVGRVAAPGPDPDLQGEVALLGTLDVVGAIVDSYEIDLLLMTSGAPRLAIFDEVARSCLHRSVRLRELSSFYEDAFGHVPVAEINTAWFQYILHPKYRAEQSLSNRVLDVVVASLCGIVMLPLLAVFALIIRRDGGPVLFRQTRIGEGGRPFTILKLRTMRPGATDDWSTAGDVRVTGVGRFLRRTHLDELPQVLNVLRGDMSIVGPRPEQPGFVDRLEQVVPFYQRRHLIKPGVTGWAQVRCGYAGSEVGSAWKVCHDLYYIKHRTFWMNIVILAETMRNLVADPQYTAQPASVDFILAAHPEAGTVTATA